MAEVVTATHSGKHDMAMASFNSRVPHEVPSFTLADVKNAIPEHLFHKPALTSLSYLARDIALISAMVITTFMYNTIALNFANIIGNMTGSDLTVLEPYFAASATRSWFVDSSYAFFQQPFVFTSILSSFPLLAYNIALTGLWIVFFWLQGVFFTGLWVLGHEAGHGGQFESKLANDTFGLIVHSLLLVPYFAWAISHRRHHSHCGDMELDEVHLPSHINDRVKSAAHGYYHNDAKVTTLTSSEQFLSEINTTFKDFSLFYRILNTFIFSALGWWAYLLTNVSGRRYPEGTSPNHFSPSSPIFSKEERPLIIISDVALVVVVLALFKFSMTFGLPTFLCLYFIPYMVANWWLVTITLLQHTHPALPHFSHERWNYIQGALTTIDRDYGAFYNWALHNINDSHVAHHMFSYMPHYNAVEATKYIKAIVGPYYLRTDTESAPFGVIKSFLSAWNDFHFVSEDHLPSLTLSHKVIDQMHKNNDLDGADENPDFHQQYVKIIEDNKDKAYENSPYGKSGERNVDKEVYWFRTLSFHETLEDKKNQ